MSNLVYIFEYKKIGYFSKDWVVSEIKELESAKQAKEYCIEYNKKVDTNLTKAVQL